MAKGEHYYVILGMKSQRNYFHILPKIQHYYVMLGMKTYKNTFSYHPQGSTAFCYAGHENSSKSTFILCLRVNNVLFCWAWKLKRNCFQNMPKVRNCCVMLSSIVSADRDRVDSSPDHHLISSEESNLYTLLK